MNKIYPVGQVNAYLKRTLEQDFLLRRIAVKGEVSNCKYHTSGHLYFSLKDETGSLACVMFAGQQKGLAFRIKDGDTIVAEGQISVYERDGLCRLYVREIRLEGEGILYRRFLALKERLEEMGMFDPCYKQPIPAFARTVGVVTAPTGAAIRDIQTISRRRNPFVQVILYPALVQGDGAAESIVRGIEMLGSAGVDVLIVGRGGGSIEDLWAFNEEAVARAIFQCPVPVISAVGHETDVTIADFAADLRAPTPSAAAELAVFDYAAFSERLSRCNIRLEKGISDKVSFARMRALGYARLLPQLSPKSRLQREQKRLSDTEEKLLQAFEQKLSENRTRLRLYAARLDGLSPLKKLSRGYVHATGADGCPVSSIAQLAKGDLLKIRFCDGTAEAEVRACHPSDEREQTQ